MFRGLRANGVRCLAPLCPKRRPLRTQHPIFTGFCRGGLHFGPHCRQSGGIALHEAPSDPFKRPASPSIGGICTTWGSDTPATRLQRASCSAKPPTSTGMEGAGGTAGLGRGALGWRGPVGERADAPNHTPAHPAPPVWRAPEGPEGTGGLRGAVPNEVRSPSLAGGRALRRPQHPWGHKQTSNNQRQTATRSVL